MRDQIDRISPRYLDAQRELHARPDGYGGKGRKWAPTVKSLIERYDATSLLDYGCGQGTLGLAVAQYRIPALRIENYDPAVEGKGGRPSFADLVTCTDVLEHIEPEYLAAVLAHLRLLARKAVFFVIALDPANKTLPDGRNAHLIIETRAWWTRRLEEAGFLLFPPDGLPFHPKYKPAAQVKRLIVVGEPC